MLKETNKYKWFNVGCHDTPLSLSRNLTNLIFDHVDNFQSQINALDLFAGDCRLGLEFIKRANLDGKNVELTFLEVDKSRHSKSLLNGHKVINQNAFTYGFTKKFDVVISNPPYLSLSAASSKEFGITWEESKKAGKNLYTLGILRAIELCKAGGVCAIIAPFAWVQGYSTEAFRSKIDELCHKVYVHANPERNLFHNVNQDIALQLFFKRETKAPVAKIKAFFKYNGYEFQDKHLTKILPKITVQPRAISVKVGNVVWNREKDKLCKKQLKAIPLIYGRNIQNGRFDFNLKELKNRQYVKAEKINESDVVRAPAIVLRRTMRGKPGNWTIDSAIISKQRRYLTENHVIVVSFVDNPPNKIESFQKALTKALKNHYYYSGSPCMSATVVRKIAQTVAI